MIDSKIRSVVKTATWRLVGSGSTMLIAFAIGGNWKAAGTIAVIQLVTNTLLYYVHERAWTEVEWGRK
jgi:uncharacterized membrane protein